VNCQHCGQPIPQPEYRIPSATVPGREYVVSFRDDRWECQCAGYTYRKTCRHIGDAMFQARAAKAYMAWLSEPVGEA
jgi:hypothetical protein